MSMWVLTKIVVQESVSLCVREREREREREVHTGQEYNEIQISHFALTFAESEACGMKACWSPHAGRLAGALLISGFEALYATWGRQERAREAERSLLHRHLLLQVQSLPLFQSGQPFKECPSPCSPELCPA